MILSLAEARQSLLCCNTSVDDELVHADATAQNAVPDAKRPNHLPSRLGVTARQRNKSPIS